MGFGKKSLFDFLVDVYGADLARISQTLKPLPPMNRGSTITCE
jgi:hypothetical protein